MSTYLIDKNTKRNLGLIRFIPKKGDKIVHTKCGVSYEYTVHQVIYQNNPKFSRALVIVTKITKPHLIDFINSIIW